MRPIREQWQLEITTKVDQLVILNWKPGNMERVENWDLIALGRMIDTTQLNTVIHTDMIMLTSQSKNIRIFLEVLWVMQKPKKWRNTKLVFLQVNLKQWGNMLNRLEARVLWKVLLMRYSPTTKDNIDSAIHQEMAWIFNLNLTYVDYSKLYII